MYPRLERIKKASGALFLLSLKEDFVSEKEKRIFTTYQPSGFILFKRNIDSLLQVTQLNKELAGIISGAIISVDEEGGRVRRLPDGAYSLPAASILAQMEQAEFDQKIRKLGETLFQCGFNMNMAPVADLRSGDDNSIVGDRSFHSDPRRVSELVTKAAEIYLAEGIIPVIKHFPGHGATTTDSHHELPVIEKDFSTIWARDLVPFRTVLKGDAGVMISHLLVPDVDMLPITLSSRWGKILFDNIKPKGLVIGDDMEMHALDKWSIRERVELFVGAGYHLMPVCSGREESLLAFLEQVIYMAEEQSDFLTLLESRRKTVISMMDHYKKLKKNPVVL